MWLGEGFSDDETDGHIDNIACFVAPAGCWWGCSLRRPSGLRARARGRPPPEGGARREGRPFEVIEVEQPRTRRTDHLGRILQSSYVNFYLPNGGVVMPAFDDPNDEKAREIIAACFPGRDILQIDTLDIVEGGGGIHCITQQEPASP